MATPIADLSYRNYEGPLEPPMHRWWSIAKASMRLSMKKKFFWLLASASGYWYLALMMIFYFTDAVAQNIPVGGTNPFFQQVVWKDQFLNAFSISQLFLFIIALLIGVGAIANDNRANALLVYLSKPVTRLDYLIGKWIGIFVPITLVTAVPTLVFFAYCYMSYQQYGFLTEDPRLPLRLALLVFVPGFFHASVALGISSLFNQGRLAGATYAGVYFISFFFTTSMDVIHDVAVARSRAVPEIVKTLYYCSVDGMQIALAKIILGTDGSGLFAQMRGPRGLSAQAFVIPQPSPALFIGLYFAICFFALFVAWTRIRAVEVVGS